MADSQDQEWTCYRGEDVTFTLTGTDNTDPAGWSLLVSVATVPGAQVVLTTTTVTVGGTGPFTFTWGFSRTQSSGLTRTEYGMDLFRTDAGSNTRLAGGTLFVKPAVRLPVAA